MRHLKKLLLVVPLIAMLLVLGGGTPVAASGGNGGPTTSMLVPSATFTSSYPDISGTSSVLDASGGSGTVKVQFELIGGIYGYNAHLIGTATLTSAGWMSEWDTTTVPDDNYDVVSVAYNSAGQYGYGDPDPVTVDNYEEPGNTKTLLYDLDGTSYNWATVAPEYAAIVVNDWDGSWIASIKAASPSTEVYVYKDLSSTRSNDCGTAPGGGSPCIVNGVFCPAGVNDAPYSAGGVGFCSAWRNHPEWFLKDLSGNLIQYAGYPGTYMMDFGNPAYQAQWLANVKADVASQGWDGVEMDNALDNTNYGTPATYPTPAAIQAATLSMLEVVGPGLTAGGTVNIANLGYNNLYPSLWASWLPYVSGFMDEFSYYWPGSSSAQPASSWSSFLEPSVATCASQRKLCIFDIGEGTLSQTQIDFGVASVLLYADGNSFISYGDGSGQYPGTSTLGAATDSAYQTSDGIWHRDFANGSVSVNPAAGTGTVTGFS